MARADRHTATPTGVGPTAMTDVTIKLVSLADGSRSPHDGKYLVSCDVDAHDGRGEVVTTADINKAKKFVTTVEAWEYWARPSKVRPRRADKQPNRPLTAYTIMLDYDKEDVA